MTDTNTTPNIMSDPITNITPEETYAKLEKANAKLNDSMKTRTLRYYPDAGFIEILSPEQKQAITDVIASTATHEAVKLDGAATRPDGKISKGELTLNPDSRGKLAISQTWHDISKQMENNVPLTESTLDIRMVPHDILEKIATDRKKQNEELSQKPGQDVVKFPIGGKQLNLTVEAAITLNNDIINFAENSSHLNKEHPHAGSYQLENQRLPAPGPIQKLEKSRLI